MIGKIISADLILSYWIMCYKFLLRNALLNFTFFGILIIVNASEEKLHKAELPPCRACKVFVESFKRGIAATEKGRFEGGDTAWEEENLGSYAKSELRLTEIQEKLCSDVKEGKDQCYAIAGEHESLIEIWWLEKQETESDFFKYFCIDSLQHCCPDNHYGQNCTACRGYPDDICNNNGKCKGAGTRKGNGECRCDPGYEGNNCDVCAENYYQAYKDEKKILCSKCHSSCDGPCSKAGPTGCVKCKPGFSADINKGCLDINECAKLKSPCHPTKYCINTQGSYQCIKCDKACTGCVADGPDSCILCADDYKLVDNVCVHKETVTRKQHVYFTRYLTYIGLCIATCIVLNKSTTLAAIVGIAVAIYIAASEYIVNSSGNSTENNTIGKNP